MNYLPEELKTKVTEYVINPPLKIRNNFLKLAEKEQDLNSDIFTHHFYTNPKIIYWSGFKKIKFSVGVFENLALNKNPEVLKLLGLKLLELKNLSFDFFNNSMFVKVRSHISSNRDPEAVKILETIPDLIDWDELSSNPLAIHILEKNIKNINWINLSNNKNAIHLLDANPHKINFFELHLNENSSQIILKHFVNKNIDWELLLRKCSDINFLVKNYINKEKDVDKISRHISANIYAIDFLEKNPQYINWKSLSWNENAGELIREGLDEKKYSKLDWFGVMQNKGLVWLIEKCDLKKFTADKKDYIFGNKNPAVIPIIEKMRYMPHVTDTFQILSNPGIFEIDKEEYNKDLEKYNFNKLKF